MKHWLFGLAIACWWMGAGSRATGAEGHHNPFRLEETAPAATPYYAEQDEVPSDQYYPASPDAAIEPLIEQDSNHAPYGPIFNVSPCEVGIWSVGVEIGSTSIDLHGTEFSIVGDNQGTSFRPYVSWEGPGGGGIRGQAWFYSNDPRVRLTPWWMGSIHSLEVETGTIDIDFFKRLRFEDSQVTIGVGARGASLEITHPSFTLHAGEAGGVTAFAEGDHPLLVRGNSCWSLFGQARVGYLLGEYEGSLNPLNGVGRTVNTGEAGIGVQYTRQIYASELLFQVGTDVKIWEIPELGHVSFGTTSMRLGWEW